MQLFKRVLLSLFPDEMMANNVNPASMFISFISAKEFFSVINRKIIENYKLNLFDIAIDPFEFKIWFGENKWINKKDIDLYYGYCWAANMNWYRFMNPSNIGNTLTMVITMFINNVFNDYDDAYFINFIFTVYLLNFVFLSRIKVFPYNDKQKNFNWFIDVFFNFYETIFHQSGQKFEIEKFEKLKKELLSEVDIFFLLFDHYQLFNDLYFEPSNGEEDFYKWIFYDELNEAHLKPLIENFVEQRNNFIYKTNFSLVEKKILQYILPADILLKYIFIEADIPSVINDIIWKVYDKNLLAKKISSFRKWKWNLEELYNIITDHRLYKKNFFDGVQKYILNYFRDEEKITWKSLSDEIDDMMSDIGTDPEWLKDFKVPERIKRESKIMEKILNFYITLLWWLWIARWDSLNFRLFKKWMIDEILWYLDWSDHKANTIHYYGSLLYNYWKNVFYYKNVSENVRAGKQKFFLPYKNTSKNIYSNMYIVRMFEENFLATLFQRTNQKDVRLYVNSKKILTVFKNMFSHEISELVKKDKNEFLNVLYKDKYQDIIESKNLGKIVKKYFNEDDVYRIKECLYSLDFWIYDRLLKYLSDIDLKAEYSDTNIYGIISSMMETLPWFLMYITFLQNDENKEINTDIIYEIYCVDVLNITKKYNKKIQSMIKKILSEFKEILELWISLDDNKAFFQIALSNWKEFVKWKEDIYRSVSGEDVLWFKWFLKNITYYNKRYLIPK